MPSRRALTPSLLLAAALLILQGCLADIRPQVAIAPDDAEASSERGRALLERAATVHGAANLARHPSYTVTMVDHWRGLLGTVANPFPAARQELEMKLITGREETSALFLNGEGAGERWGREGARTWVLRPGAQERAWEQNDDILFILGAFHYFFEFPSRIKDAELIRYAGPQTIDGVTYTRVLATWGSFAPNATSDQYIVFINKKTGRIEKMQFTVRSTAPFLVVTMHLSDFRELDGALLPHTLTLTEGVEDDLEREHLHQAKVRTVTFE